LGGARFHFSQIRNGPDGTGDPPVWWATCPPAPSQRLLIESGHIPPDIYLYPALLDPAHTGKTQFSSLNVTAKPRKKGEGRLILRW